jgi:hypothetical protein
MLGAAGGAVDRSTAVRRQELEAYTRRGRRRLQGWLCRIDAEIFQAVLRAQADAGLRGGVAEIGVHHGKSFIPLCLALRPDERAACVDVFDQQHLNVDRSGEGDRAVFERNLARAGVPRAQVDIFEQSSLDLTLHQFLDAVGPVRFFSVDGGHWLEIVQSDLTVAEASLAAHGVIALDDFHRPEWPEVSAGLFAWHASRHRPIVPFAIGFNKLYLCLEDRVGFYQEVLARTPFLAAFAGQPVSFLGQQTAIYTTFPYPEYPLKMRLDTVARIYATSAYEWARRTFGSIGAPRAA